MTEVKVGHYALYEGSGERPKPPRTMVDDGLVVRFERKPVWIDCFCGNGSVIYRATKCIKTCEYCEAGQDIKEEFAAAIIEKLWRE